ncbi:hypothetical protein CBL_10551 [Carabus blaptoides fortunei]
MNTRENYWARPLATHELLSEIENLSANQHKNLDVIFTPPNDEGLETEEDSGGEECSDPNRLNPRQLGAEAAVVKRIGTNDDNEILHHALENSETASLKQPKKVRKQMREWKTGDSPKQTCKPWTNVFLPPITLCSQSHPMNFFLLFSDKNEVDMIMRQTATLNSIKRAGVDLKKIVNETGERMLGMLSSQLQPLSNPFDSSASYLENSCTAIDNTTNEQSDNIVVEIDESITTDNLNDLPLASVSPEISVPSYLNKVPFTSSSAVRNTNKRKRHSMLDDILQEKQEQVSVKKQKLECEIEHQNKLHLAKLETEEIDKKLKLYELEEICPLRKEKELMEISIKETEKRIKLMELKIKELEYKMLLKKTRK